MNNGYKKWIEDNLQIVNKDGNLVPFRLNKIQESYLTERTSNKRDIILKARQQGFSSLILAVFTADFLLKENTFNVVVADNTDNAQGLLKRVKDYLRSVLGDGFEKVLKYNSKYELYLEKYNTTYQIGTAENTSFGRSKTITNLHLSESAFYPHMEEILAGALQAVVPEGRVVIETTANGFNEFKGLWDRAVMGESNFNPLFFKASDFYSPEFLEEKKRELGRMFSQEYPETPEEAFLSSGDMYFDALSLKAYLDSAREPITEGAIYV